MIQSRFFILAGLILAVGVLLAGCALFLPGAGGEPIQAEVVRSEKDRVTSPDVDQAELDELVAGNSAFAFDLFQAVRESNTNLFYSPYSISAALAMTYAGARGDTEVQMGNTLHFSLAQERLHPAFNFLDLELASRSELPEGWEGEGPTLNIANSIWGQIGYSFLSDFLDVLAENYGAGLRLLNFMNAPENRALSSTTGSATRHKVRSKTC
jgi:serpin B